MLGARQILCIHTLWIREEYAIREDEKLDISKTLQKIYIEKHRTICSHFLHNQHMSSFSHSHFLAHFIHSFSLTHTHSQKYGRIFTQKCVVSLLRIFAHTLLGQRISRRTYAKRDKSVRALKHTFSKCIGYRHDFRKKKCFSSVFRMAAIHMLRAIIYVDICTIEFFPQCPKLSQFFFSRILLSTCGTTNRDIDIIIENS